MDSNISFAQINHSSGLGEDGRLEDKDGYNNNMLLILGEISRMKSAEELEEVCPKLLLAIRQNFHTFPAPSSSSSSSSLLVKCFAVCRKLAREQHSKLVRKSASAALKILLGSAAMRGEMNTKGGGGHSSAFIITIWDDFLTLLNGLEEPQYHLIVAMLPKFEPLISFCSFSGFCPASAAYHFSWSWLRLLFERAINHPNGWIRIWAILRAVKLPVELQKDGQFLLSIILPAMNGIDPLWRLIEREELAQFLVGLGQMLGNAFKNCPTKSQKVHFLTSLLTFVSSSTNLWTASPLYFLSTVLLNGPMEVEGILPSAHAEFLPLWRLVFMRIADIPHIPMRMATMANFFSFFVLLHDWSNELVGKFPQFLANNLPPLANKEELEGTMEWAIRIFMAHLDSSKNVELNGNQFSNEFRDECHRLLFAHKNLPGHEEEENFCVELPKEDDTTLLMDRIERLSEFACESKKFELIRKALEQVEKLLEQLNIAEFESSELIARFCQLIQCTYDQCQEQRKSRHFLPNLRYFLRICFHPKILKFAKNGNELLNLVQAKFGELFGQSQLNQPIGVALGEQLYISANSLEDGHLWVEQLVSLATFGPVIKREHRVLCYAHQQIYENPQNQHFLPADRINLLHLCAHQCRLFGIHTIDAILLAIPDKSKQAHFTSTLLREIIHKFDDWDKNKSSSFGLSMAHRHKTRLAQLLLLFVDFANTPELSELIFSHGIHHLLDTSQQYSIKLLTEWTLNILMMAKSKQAHADDEEMFTRFLELEEKFSKHRVGSICSWLNIFAHHQPSSNNHSLSLDHFRAFFSRILPWTTAQNFSVRCTALAAVRLAWQRNLDKLANCGEFSLIANVVGFDLGISTGNGTRVVNNLCDDFYFAHFDPVNHFSLEAIFQIFPAKTGMPADEQISPKLLLDHFGPNLVISFGLAQGDLWQHSIETICRDEHFAGAPSLIYRNLMKSINHPLPSTEFDNGEENKRVSKFEIGGQQQQQSNEDAIDNHSGNEVQRKLNIFNGGDGELKGKKEEEENGADGEEKDGDGNRGGGGGDLIVCATLVNKAANLGGLCRTCEIFKVRTLCLSNALLLDTVEFKALSLNAENWLHIEQVKSMDLAAYLEQKRAQGYKCIAAEQTTRSVPLEHFQFPRRSILLLGDEKEGISPEFFAQVDGTVEITQLGKTRSLNVHVSAALCIHKFAEQWMMMKGADKNGK